MVAFLRPQLSDQITLSRARVANCATLGTTTAIAHFTVTVYPYGMRFAVVPMRFRGRPLPRAELANRSAWIGDVRIEEIRDEALLRYVRVARVLVLDRPRQVEMLGELFEPQIIAMSPQAFTLSGYLSA